jgi:hypothetical protein
MAVTGPHRRAQLERDSGMPGAPVRTYRFSITVTVEPGDPGYDDPE